ncbi:fruit protein pKIWI502 isoform X2 [Selaginella moellendorffii]|uniref:fruit protein pKIWI502 isoform X2 n=1 Tax=Selaginella moellendorffii TaxID=88036 RepID=UPI000D1C4EE2|nr:fruit protein pKIWI502 isoform X2 [Selaginella moellendorffii]|eukprot:XP_024540492.1 fruit protein pKIWI502 isoform X2 [Selaginella moellendorffii]
MAIAAATAAAPSLRFAKRYCSTLSKKSSSARVRFVVRAQWKQEVLWTSAPLVEIAPAAEQLFHIVLDIGRNPELQKGHSKPGQFVQMKKEEHKPGFFAIASPPSTAAKGFLEFLVKDVEGTTSAVLCDLAKGDKVDLSQVMGKGFDIDQLYPPEKFQTVLFFATGSGISPIRSLIEAGIDANRRSDVRLYYGARSLERMAYRDKFKEWEASGVSIIPVLSQPDGSWMGESGYVQVYGSLFEEHKYSRFLSSCYFSLWPQGHGQGCD